MKIPCLLSVLLLAPLMSAPAQNAGLMPAGSPAAPSSWPENREARLSVMDWLLDSLLATPAPGEGRIIRQPEAGSRVKFEVRTQDNARYYLFLNEGRNGFPIAARGNIIIKRSLEDGRFLQLKIFFRDREDCFIRFFPQGERCSLDVFLLGHRLYQRVMLPLSFQALLTAPFRQVMQLTSGVVDWPLLLHQGEREADLRLERVLERLRPLLAGLPDFEDGAMDEEGNYVRIADGREIEDGGLNCSGFAKWVVDGFYYPLAGRLLNPEALREKHLGLRGNRWSDRREEERDPYFGLDWSRNLALSLASARAPLSRQDPESCDVRETPFLRYTEDVGYPVSDLELLLYLESRVRPGFFYIGSLNRDYGAEPVLRQHFHLVVLFPYFDAQGSFRVAVLERNRETGLPAVLERYAGDYIHLVRLDSRGEFLPALFWN